MPVFEERPKRIEAIKWTGDNLEEVIEFIYRKWLEKKNLNLFEYKHIGDPIVGKHAGNQLKISHGNFWIKASIGNYIFHGDLTEWHAYTAEQMKSCYKEVAE